MRRFLIADDHSVVRKGLKQILVEAFPSAVIEEVTNAEDLLKRAIMEQWDVVVSDISMPGRSGLEIFRNHGQHLQSQDHDKNECKDQRRPDTIRHRE
jgi:two-component system invasion response regulator UvrY